jgi:exonuclease VII large subunit
MPLDLVRRNNQLIDSLTFKLLRNIDRKFLLTKGKLDLLSGSIESHNVSKTLKRGFALVKQGDKYISRSKYLDKNKSASLKFYDNDINIEIKK